jgi:secretion/DNA translocation related CpaE-like protein
MSQLERADESRPLVCTRDPELLDDLLRLAAAGSVEVDVPADPSTARPRWMFAPLVLVGADVAEEYALARLPRRPGLILVAHGPLSEPPDPDLGVGMAADDELWAVAADLGADHVIGLPAAEAWLVDRYAAQQFSPGHGGDGRVVSVMGGRGGAGASVLATALAVTAARSGRRTLLIDADPLGGGLDLLLGREQTDGLRWPDLADTAGRMSASALQAALPRVGDLCVLSWDRGDLLTVPVEAADAALDAGRRGSDLVVVDLPRQPDEATVRVLQASDLTLLVVPAEVRASAAASRVVRSISPHCARLSCVVRGPAPSGLRAPDLAAMLGLPLAGVLKAEPGISLALERGEAPAATGRGPLAVLSREVLADLDADGLAA